MMRLNHPNTRPLLIAMLLISPCLAWSEEDNSEILDAGPCAEDEVDAGEYCVKIIEAEPEPIGSPKATPFRKESMMPGVIRRGSPQNAVKPALPSPATVAPLTIPAPVVAQGGFGIQLGAWSAREVAAQVGQSIVATGISVVLSPLERGERVLWATIAGPYASKDDAKKDLQSLKSDSRFEAAWIKSLKDMRLEGIEIPGPQATEAGN